MTEESNRVARSNLELLAQQRATIEQLHQVVARLRQQSAGQHSLSSAADQEFLLDLLEQSQQIIRTNQDLNSLLGQLLDLVLERFPCDRAWLAYPCDPDLAQWKIPLERCGPDCLERATSAGDLPLPAEIADCFRSVLTATTAVRFDGSSGNQLPPEAARRDGIRKQLILAIRPLAGKAWLLGLDQCSRSRSWRDTEVRFFQQFGHHLEAALSSLLSLEELHNREQQLGSLIRNLPGTVYRYASQTGATPLYISDNVKQLSGYPAEDFLTGKRNFSDLCHPQDRSRIERSLQRALHRKEPFRLEYRLIDSAGETRWVLEQGQAIYERDGAVKCYDGMIFDFSDRKRLDQELLQLRNLLSSTINAMPSTLIGINIQHRVSQWNREAEQLTGIPQREALGKSLKEIFPELPLSQVRIEQAVRSRKVDKQTRVSWEYRQQLRIIDIAIYPIRGRQVAGAVIRIDEVTERVKMEELIIQHDKMLSLGGLAAGIAHEVNNPLAGIMQNFQVLRNRLSEQLPRNQQIAIDCGTRIDLINNYLKRRELLHLIDTSTDSAQRAADIITNMLSFSRSDNISQQSCDLRQLLDATIELALSSYNPKHQNDLRKIRITREYAADLPAVLCQQSNIQQVFLNLLNNGAQAMIERLRRWEASEEKSPQELPRFILRLFSNGDRLRCEIEDNGKGMDEETRKRVFEPFFTTKPAGQGTGLGMAIGYFIICDQHRGSLSVESAADVGSRFIIELPIRQQAQ